MRIESFSYEEISEAQKVTKSGIKATLENYLAPWASKIVRVCGGYTAFESWSDYEIWKNQK